MEFNYKISLDLEVEFDVPLLGVDTTTIRRKQANDIALSALKEMIDLQTTSHIKIDREIQESNFNGNVKGKITLRSAALLKLDTEKNKL